jgi:hypothetical protein
MKKNRPYLALLAALLLAQGCAPAAPAAPTPTDFPAPTAAAPGGEPMPRGDLPGWKMIFSEDFETPLALGQWGDCSPKTFVCSRLPDAYTGRWWAYPEGWPDTSGHGRYSPGRTLSIADGVFDIFVHTENGRHLVSAPVPLINGSGGPLGQLYGRYVVRFKADAQQGYKVAWLLWPDSETWPRDGEIDFPEANLDGMVTGFVHYQAGTAPNDQDGFYTGVPFAGAWHTAVTEWTPAAVRFILDGKMVGTATERIPDTPMHWVLQTETALDGSVPADEASGHIRIDWVAVYAPQQ